MFISIYYACRRESHSGVANRDTEWDLLGPYKDIGNNTKLKSTHFTDSSLQSTFNINIPPPSLPKVRKPWYQPGLRFPCPLKRHNHEMSDCKEIISLALRLSLSVFLNHSYLTIKKEPTAHMEWFCSIFSASVLMKILIRT